jgi:hypothetical protein
LPRSEEVLHADDRDQKLLRTAPKPGVDALHARNDRPARKPKITVRYRDDIESYVT